jgi:hypothetical protein
MTCEYFVRFFKRLYLKLRYNIVENNEVILQNKLQKTDTILLRIKSVRRDE